MPPLLFGLRLKEKSLMLMLSLGKCFEICRAEVWFLVRSQVVLVMMLVRAEVNTALEQSVIAER